MLRRKLESTRNEKICQHLLLAPSEICESLERLCFQRILNFGTSWPTFIKTQHLSFVQTDHNTIYVCACVHMFAADMHSKEDGRTAAKAYSGAQCHPLA